MTDIVIILNKLHKKDGFKCFGALSQKKIRMMESDLGITFPESYKVFLEKYGYIEWFGHTIYGYSDDEDCNTVVCTMELRKDDLA